MILSVEEPVEAGSFALVEFMKYDIVYILKNDYSSEELRYSLRSVCKNFPYRKIWFYGGKPKGIQPDEMVEFIQTGANKWERVNNTLRMICMNDEITEDFWLFNDDFFIMKKLADLDPMYASTLEQRYMHIKQKHGRATAYSGQLKRTAAILERKGYDTLDYALHVPMLINRKKALQTLKAFSGCPMFRSLYGNHHSIGGTKTKDVKITSLDVKPTGSESMLSTEDNAFSDGAVGKYIRSKFRAKCRYEVDDGSDT